MKIRCLLVEDEPLAIRLLENHIAQMPMLEVTGTCGNAMEALQFLNNHQVDLLFLDINMPGLSGLDFLRSLPSPPKTIITTAHREFALEGFELEVIDFLLKPVTFERFFKSVERVLRIAENNTFGYIYLKSGYKFVKVDLGQLLYAESVRDYVKFYTTNGIVSSKYKIGDLEKKLHNNGFLRIHRSFIVNLSMVTAFTTSDIEIRDKEIPIGENFRETVMKVLRNNR